MRNEEEIRAHVRALLVLAVKPCDCAGADHTMRCVIGGRMMEVRVAALKWALGDEKEAPLVAKLNAAADEFTRGG